jgi:hypothetical protein
VLTDLQALFVAWILTNVKVILARTGLSAWIRQITALWFRLMRFTAIVLLAGGVIHARRK